MRVQWIACAIAIALPGRAGADGIGLITVSSDRVAVATAIAAVVREAGGHGRVLDDAVGEARAASASGAVPIETLQRFRRVREQIDEGWRAYHRVQLEFAASRLAAARTDAETIVALPGGAVLYADASLRLGAVLAQLGRPDARDAIALALALDPDRPITLAEFSPDLVAAVDAARASTRPAHQVRITSEPPEASLSVDGADAGRTPAAVELALGQHVVILRARGGRPLAQAVAVEPATTELAFTIDHDDGVARLERGAELGLDESSAQLLADGVLQHADLDEVLLVVETDRRGGPTLLVQRCAGAPARCTAVVEIGYAESTGLVAAARSAWQAVRAADLRYAPSVFGDPRVTDHPPAGHRCEVCRSPWLWGGVGAAAIAGTILVLELVSATRPPPILEAPGGTFTH